MTIDEAIEYHEHRLKNDGIYMLREAVDAEQLGLEALKRIRDCRRDWNLTITERLPGETEKLRKKTVL